MTNAHGATVLVAEKIGDSGRRAAARALRRRARLRLGPRRARPSGSATTTGILIRSATKLDAELLGAGHALRAVGRAGVGRRQRRRRRRRPSAGSSSPTRRSRTSITAAEHTMALLLALARNIPQAHASLTSGQVGALEVLRRRAVREDARDPRLRPDRPARRAAGARLRDAGDRLRPVRRRRALPRARRREGRDRRTTSTRPPTSSRCTCPRRPRPRAGSTPRRSPSARTACACSTSRAGRWSSTRT